MSDYSGPLLANYENASCHYFSDSVCQSCTLLELPTGVRLETKLKQLNSTLAKHGVTPRSMREPVVLNYPWQSRHKVKMSISGSIERPVIGITRQDRSSWDIVGCQLSSEPIQAFLNRLPALIKSHQLTPYDIELRTGELKHVIVITTHDHKQGILRFVLRSRDALSQVQNAAAELQREFPWITVVTCNIQPIPAAILEGPEEIDIAGPKFIREQFGSLPLYFAAQSFMQVTPAVAEQLYSRAAQIIKSATPKILLDLFCGAGGFSLSAAPHCESIVGVEISPQAIASAQMSAKELALTHLEFNACDVELFLAENPSLKPNMVMLNPPRRGLSAGIISQLISTAPEHILYSSCSPETFARDAQTLSNAYELLEITPFDMFPMTYHWEILGLFKRSY
ncbi:MAG: 23S rRNA (uracil(1939)-C(5))-methyltransferase RlmD [Pseudomonadota bacterium]|jgi:23S rRNA (uracil747-C5)-methyltransferase